MSEAKKQEQEQENTWVRDQPSVGSLDWEIQRAMIKEAQAHLTRIRKEMRLLYIRKYGVPFPRRLNPALQQKALTLYTRFFWVNINPLREKLRKLLTK